MPGGNGFTPVPGKPRGNGKQDSAGKARRRMPMARWFVDRLPQRGIPSVSLRRLLPEAQFVGCPDWEVSGCTDDHRRLDPGQVFVAVRDVRGYDGHAFVLKPWTGARGRGRGASLPRGGPAPGDCARRQVRPRPDLPGLGRRSLAALMTLGVTGTSGKTVTTCLSTRSSRPPACGAAWSARWAGPTA